MRYKLLILLVILLIFLGGCAWLSEGIFNVFDPKVQVRISSFEIVPPAEGEIAPTLTLNLMSLNQVGARFGTFYYTFSKKVGGSSTEIIPELYETYAINVLLPPGTEEAGGTVTITNIPLYFQREVDYMNDHPEISDLLLTLWLKGIDEADHKIELSVFRDYPITVLPPKVEAINLSASPTTLAPGETSIITVQALSGNGKPVNGAVIVLTATGGTLSATSLITDSTGTATATFTAGNTPGEATITATSGEATSEVTLTISAPQPASLTVTATPATVSAGGQVIVGVQVKDASGQPLEGATVAVAASAGTLASSSLTTDATGFASTTLDTTGVAAGTTITITAISGGVTGTATVNVQ